MAFLCRSLTRQHPNVGPLALVQAVIPHMVARKKGKIVNVGSVTGFCPTPWAGVYASSKAALHAMTDVLRWEIRLYCRSASPSYYEFLPRQVGR